MRTFFFPGQTVKNAYDKKIILDYLHIYPDKIGSPKYLSSSEKKACEYYLYFMNYEHLKKKILKNINFDI